MGQQKMSSISSSLKYVDHTYRDFSRYVEEGGELVKHKKSGNNFPARLHKILSVSDPGHSDVITWMPHGRAWKIHDKNRLISDVIPEFFVCKKYESFTRQLNGWGFKRLHQSGPDFGCYYHECFLRDLPDLTCLIRRLPTNLGKSTPYVEGEPNFYLIGVEYPLPPPPRDVSKTAMYARQREGIAVKIGSRPPKVMPATIGRPDWSSSEPSFKRENIDISSPVFSIISDVNNSQIVPPSSSTRVSSTQEPSAPRLVARASTEPLSLAPMPLNLCRHPSAPFYCPPSHPGFAQHPQPYSQYPPQYHGMYGQYSGGGNPYQLGHFPADHHPQFQFSRGFPSNGEYDYFPSRYSEFNPQVGHNFQHGNGNMHPLTSSGARGVADDLGSNRQFLKQEEELSYSNEEVDEFAPIPVQFSPKSTMRKSDGNSVAKMD